MAKEGITRTILVSSYPHSFQFFDDDMENINWDDDNEEWESNKSWMRRRGYVHNVNVSEYLSHGGADGFLDRWSQRTRRICTCTVTSNERKLLNFTSNTDFLLEQ